MEGFFVLRNRRSNTTLFEESDLRSSSSKNEEPPSSIFGAEQRIIFFLIFYFQSRRTKNPYIRSSAPNIGPQIGRKIGDFFEDMGGVFFEDGRRSLRSLNSEVRITPPSSTFGAGRTNNCPLSSTFSAGRTKNPYLLFLPTPLPNIPRQVFSSVLKSRF